MALDSLFERGTLENWREFTTALRHDNGTLIEETLFMCERTRERGSAALAKTLVEQVTQELRKKPR